MIKAIDKKYCVGDLVQLMPATHVCHLIVSADEIILLKVGDDVLVNKYANHPSRESFPYHEEERHDWAHFTELFEYNKMYLNFKGCNFRKYYFFKGSERALYLDEHLPVDEGYGEKKSLELDRQGIEELFDGSNYDAMYIIDRNGKILFARNDKDNVRFGENVIPSDDEIVEMELRKRKGDYNLARALNSENDTKDNYRKAEEPKSIDEIKNLKLYGPALFSKYAHLLLTVKDGKFDLKWFRIDFLLKDKFRLTTSPIVIVEPTIDDVLEFSQEYEIRNTPEPVVSIPSFESVHTPENQDNAMNVINTTIDSYAQQELGQSQEPKDGFYKRLQRRLKGNVSDKK